MFHDGSFIISHMRICKRNDIIKAWDRTPVSQIINDISKACDRILVRRATVH